MAIDWGRFARIAGAGLASIGTFIFGQPDIWMKTLLAFIVIDYLSGFIAAILKKTMYFFVLAVAHCVDIATGAGGVLQGIAVGVLISNEGISILENCAKCGIPIPERLIRALAQIKGESEKTEK